MEVDLSHIPLEEIRKNWNIYSNQISQNLYNEVWKDWSRKFGVNLIDPNTILLRSFVENSIVNNLVDNGRELILPNLISNKRYQLHILCDLLGIHHQSLTANGERHLHLYKPNTWLWEFSEKNPYSQGPEFSEAKRKKRQERNRKLSKKYCCECEVTGAEAELFESVYISGIYCEDCLASTSDGDGGTLDEHKFEPI